MTKQSVGAVIGLGLCSLVLWGSVAQAETYDLVARYVLETVRAFRSAYVLHVVEHTKDVGIAPKEDWVKNAHAIPLPAQFVKTAGSDLDTFEIGIIGLTPIYTSNLPKTDAEAEALKGLMADSSKKIITFSDGKQFKAMAADFAVSQSCADCHNRHPESRWRNFKKGDVMGAIVVRLTRQAN
nr:DUF3365 domain-containing protein [Nitrospirota bacterium]